MSTFPVSQICRRFTARLLDRYVPQAYAWGYMLSQLRC